MNLDLHKIKSVTFVTCLMFFVVFCSGILFLLMFNEPLFVQIDVLKIILLSASISTPVWLINSFLVSRFDKGEIGDEDEVGVVLQVFGMIGSFISIPVIYIPVLIKLYCDITLREGVTIAIGIQLLITLFSIVLLKILKREEEKK